VIVLIASLEVEEDGLLGVDGDHVLDAARVDSELDQPALRTVGAVVARQQ
jgi:hypothetical protein